MDMVNFKIQYVHESKVTGCDIQKRSSYCYPMLQADIQQHMPYYGNPEATAGKNMKEVYQLQKL